MVEREEAMFTLRRLIALPSGLIANKMTYCPQKLIVLLRSTNQRV